MSATLKDPDSYPHPDPNEHILFFRFLHICMTSQLARSRRLNSPIHQTINSSFLAFNKTVKNPIAGHKIKIQKRKKYARKRRMLKAPPLISSDLHWLMIFFISFQDINKTLSWTDDAISMFENKFYWYRSEVCPKNIKMPLFMTYVGRLSYVGLRNKRGAFSICHTK